MQFKHFISFVAVLLPFVGYVAGTPAGRLLSNRTHSKQVTYPGYKLPLFLVKTL